jgi:DNA-binding NarL/FixJ family response regulator
VRYAIEQYGEGKYCLEWAENLSAGLNTLSQEDIDIVILDLGLPESSGPESYAWVREVAPDVPVVILTGDSRQETELDVTASGVAGFLVKDQVSGRGLLQVIRTVLNANKPQPKRSAETLRELIPQSQTE